MIHNKEGLCGNNGLRSVTSVASLNNYERLNTAFAAGAFSKLFKLSAVEGLIC